ncbi:hypothetical protein BH11BAC2_BH11BAC2_22850 [soil metagenome]
MHIHLEQTHTMKLFILGVLLFVATNTFAQTDTSGKLEQHRGYKGESYNSVSGFGPEKFRLPGRKLLNNPFADSLSSFAATVVVAISVNAAGKVTAATGPARGSTTMDSTLFSKAKTAALNAQFSPLDSVPLQSGMLMFYFRKEK